MNDSSLIYTSYSAEFAYGYVSGKIGIVTEIKETYLNQFPLKTIRFLMVI